MPEQKQQASLDGIRVVEIGSSVAAPYAGWILAALGADTIKVERPGAGDDARQWGALFEDGTSSVFHYLNRDKRSITVDLKQAEKRDWLREFCVSTADVVIQNMRPCLIDDYDLGAEALRSASPRLVYCNLWAFGNTGPLKDRPGYDPLMQALSGLMSITGEVGRPPVRVGPSMIDLGTGMWCAIGILAALNKRSDTGQGCIVDASLYETSLAWMASATTTAEATRKSPGRQGTRARGMAPYEAYMCTDGYLIVAAPNDRLFERLTMVLGLVGLTDDERFDTNQKRYDNIEALNGFIAPVLASRTAEHWRAKLDEVGIPSAPVRDTLQMLDDDQMHALGILQDSPGAGPRSMGLPLSFDGERPPLRRAAPGLGEHNDEIKGETE